MKSWERQYIAGVSSAEIDVKGLSHQAGITPLTWPPPSKQTSRIGSSKFFQTRMIDWMQHLPLNFFRLKELSEYYCYKHLLFRPFCSGISSTDWTRIVFSTCHPNIFPYPLSQNNSYKPNGRAIISVTEFLTGLYPNSQNYLSLISSPL